MIKQGVKEPIVACLGLTFKPDIDDLRESPAVTVVDNLVQLGINIKVVEPNINEHDTFSLSNFEDVLDSDLVVMLVKHREFYSENSQEKLLIVNTLDYCGALV